MGIEQDRQAFQQAWELLANGDYAEGFARFEGVRFRRGTSPTAKPLLSFPEWDGSPVQSLLVLPEQGLGDQIQFARFIPQIVASGVRVTLYASPVVAALLADLGASVVPATGTRPIERHDAWVLSASLPHRLRVTLETLSGAPYIKAPRDRLTSAPQHLRYGVVWRGNPDHPHDAHRSMRETDAAPLLNLPGAVCLHPEITGARDMADTAAIIDRLEAVITIDTSVAHLAGAMGKRTLLMLPANNPDWRWMLERADSPWYDSIEIFRQPTPGDWATVTARVTASL